MCPMMQKIRRLRGGVIFVPNDAERRRRLGGGVMFVPDDAERRRKRLEVGSDLFPMMQKKDEGLEWLQIYSP